MPRDTSGQPSWRGLSAWAYMLLRHSHAAGVGEPCAGGWGGGGAGVLSKLSAKEVMLQSGHQCDLGDELRWQQGKPGQ